MRYESGMRFGRVVLTEKIGSRTWSCVCDCGNVTSKDIGNLPRTNTCCHTCVFNPLRKHSGAGTKEYRTWKNIKTRCFNPKHRQAKDYSERGITMHPGWVNDYAAFFQYIGPAPSSAHTVDRLDNSKGYEPGNVSWVTREVNCNNKRNNVTITYKGEVKTATQWARELGIKPSIILDRVRSGWTAEKTLNTPPKQ